MIIGGDFLTDIMTLLVEFLGEPTTPEQIDMLYFFAFFLLVFVVNCVFDMIIGLSKI